MPTSSQKSKATQQTTSTKSKSPERARRQQSSDVASILHLQRTAGNQAVRSLLDGSTPGLTVTAPGDAHEHEADRVADQVMHASESGAQLQTGQVQAGGSGEMAAPAVAHEVLQSPGQPLPASAREFMEPRFGHDFSQVRVHTGSEAASAARAVRAQAYTSGNDIVFGSGAYAPATRGGRQLLAHELAHVVQQASTPGVMQRKTTTESPVDKPQRDPEEEKVLRAADRARSNPKDGTVMFLSAAEIVYRLVHSHLASYEGLISGVGYSEAVKGVSVEASENSVSITVGQDFVLGTTDTELNKQVTELQSAIQSKAQGLDRKQAPAAGQPAVKQEAAAQQPPPPDVVPAAQPAATKSAAPNSAFRDAILKEVDKWEGAQEESGDYDKKSAAGKKFDAFRSPKVIEQARIDSAQTIDSAGKPILDASGKPKKSTKYTTCIDFQGTVLTNVGKYKRSPVIGTNAEQQAKDIGAWHDASPNMPDRPKEGDIYVLADKDKHGVFSHIGYIRGIDVKADGTEIWKTVDGGQGIAAQYDERGKQVKAGHEALKSNERTYQRDTNLLSGESNQGRKWGWLKGWVDIDKLPKDEKERQDMQIEAQRRKSQKKAAPKAAQ